MDIRKIRTGRDIANLMRKSKQGWVSGSLARDGRRCALGMIAHMAGIRDDCMGALGLGPEGLSMIYTNNDDGNSVEGAARRIEENAGDLDISYELNRWLTGLCEIQKERGYDPIEPIDIDLLDDDPAEGTKEEPK